MAAYPALRMLVRICSKSSAGLLSRNVFRSTNAVTGAFYSSARLTAFDERWSKLTQAEKDLVAKEYEHLQKDDWKSLTIDQKRIRTTFIIFICLITHGVAL